MIIAILSYEFQRHPRAKRIAKTLKKNGFKVRQWGARKVFLRGPRILRAILNYLFAFFEICFINADVYWVENIPDIIYLGIPFLGRVYVYDRRSPWAKQLQLEFRSGFLVRIARIVENIMIRFAKHIVVPSTPMKYEFDYKKPVTVIPNFPEESFKKKPTRNLRQELNIPATRKIFIYVGKLSKIEGTDLLPEVANALKGLNAELWIVGDGPARHIVERIVKKHNHVRWFGWVQRDKLADYITAADYGLVPRHKTPFSIFYNHEGIHKIGEYFIYGKPVIACGIAPSPYYLVTEPDNYAETIARVAKGEIEPPKPPHNLTWEKYCEKAIIDVISALFENSIQKVGKY